MLIDVFQEWLFFLQSQWTDFFDPGQKYSGLKGKFLSKSNSSAIFGFLINNDFSKVNQIRDIKFKILKLCSRIEYLEIRNKNNLSKNINKKNFKIFIAYYLNNVRLIDNF